MDRLKKAPRWILALFIEEAFTAWTWPIVVTAFGTLIGLFNDIPVYYLFVGAVIILSMASSVMLNITRWRAETRVEGKLVFDAPRLQLFVDDDGRVNGMQIGVQLRNRADFPLYLTTESIETLVVDNATGNKNYPPKLPNRNNGFSVGAGSLGWYDDPKISLTPTSVGGFTAKLRCTVRYGKKTTGTHVLNIDKRADVFVNQSRISGDPVWYNV